MYEQEVVGPAKKDARVEALHRLQILDTDYEPPFDRVARMVATFFGVPNVGIHLLDNERQWVKAFEGQPFACAREDSVCQFALAGDDLLIIPDLTADPRTQELGIVTGPPHLRFYAGAPLRTRDGQIVGTLCLIDTKPRAELDARETHWLREFADLVTETMELRVDYYRSQGDLRRAMEFDAVTGLRKRTSVVREAQHLLDTTPAPAGVAVAKIQLDRMNLVMGATGQAGSSAVLRIAAARLEPLLGPKDLLGRTNDGFIIVRVRQAPPNDRALDAWLDSIANKALGVLVEPMVIEGDQINISASIGIAASADGSSVHEVLDAASAASLASADRGGNQIQRFVPDAFTAYRERVSVEADLRQAVAQGDFEIHYQPIVDISAGRRTVGAEALVRWPRGDRPAIGPERFIPMAEEFGLIHELGLGVFDTACRDLATWLEQGHDLWISVNLSPLQFEDPGLADKLAERVQAAGLECSRLKLEITEGALSTHIDSLSRTLHQLRAAGFLLALDDFGTGHSSLARLIRMPFDTLKVDRGFVSDCPDGPGAAVVRSVSALAQELGMKLVAEGVEHEDHERFLQSQGCALAQGFHYAKAMPAEAMTIHLAGNA